jgi:hypothetical protein
LREAKELAEAKVAEQEARDTQARFATELQIRAAAKARAESEHFAKFRQNANNNRNYVQVSESYAEQSTQFLSEQEVEDEEVEDEKDEDDGKYDEPDPGKYKELFDLIRQSNDDRQGKNFTDKENARMVHLLRYYNLDDDAPEMPYAEPHTRKRMILLRFMTPKEKRGEEMTLEDLQEMDRRSEREGEEREKRDKKLSEDMKAQEEKNKRYRIEEAKAKRGEKPSDEFIHTVLGAIYRDALKEKEKKGKVSLRDLMSDPRFSSEKERKEKK